MKNFLGRLRTNSSGSIAIMMGLMLIPLLGAVGFGVDTLRLHRAHQILDDSVRAAAGAYERSGLMQPEARLTMARDYFHQNYQAVAGGDMVLKQFRVAPSGTSGQMQLTASADVSLFLMRFLGPDKAEISASVVTEAAAQSLEVALVVDVGGAMAAEMETGRDSEKGPTYMSLAQAGALSVLQKLYPAGKPRTGVYAAIVPFTQVVNVGKASRPWVSGFERLPGGTDWRGCVMERSDLSLLEAAPVGSGVQASFPAYVVPSDTPAMKGQMKHRFITGQEPVHGQGSNSGCGPEILPLSTQPVQFWNKLASLSPGVLLAAQGESQPYDNTPSVGYGASLTSEGLVWGWRSLSPAWRGLWSGMPGAMPFAYETAHAKALVLVTSGDLSLTDFDSAFGRLSGQPEDNLLGAKNLPQAVEALETRLRQTCEGILKANIHLYVVQLGGDGGPVGRTLQGCLAKEGLATRYMAPETPEAVKKAFEDVYLDLSRYVPVLGN